MKDKLKVIDGGKTDYAPRPHHGLVRALYDTVDACGGANLEQIKKYLPAAVDNIAQVLRKKRLQRALYNAVYSGYLIHDDTKAKAYWQIAGIDYYTARQAHVKEIEARHAGQQREPRGEQFIPQTYDPFYTFRISKVFIRRVGLVGLAVMLVVIGAVAGRLL